MIIVIRHCDGTDPNLLTDDGRPCACGQTFDDVERSTIHPHHSVRARLGFGPGGEVWSWPHPAHGETVDLAEYVKGIGLELRSAGDAPAGERLRKGDLPESRALRVSGFTLAWVAWVLFFLVVEAWALLRKARGDTFSENWWSLFRVRAKVPLPARLALAVLQLAFAAWLTGHLVFGWWTL